MEDPATGRGWERPEGNGHEAEFSRDNKYVLAADEDNLLSLLQAAFRVRRAHFGRKVKLNMLVNAKSGICPEDCGYCSQSIVSTAWARQNATSAASAIFEASVRRANMDSPKNMRPIATP